MKDGHVFAGRINTRMKPTLSVITITRNNREGLARTLASVDRQNVGPFEVIVIDGHSTDGTSELLAEFGTICGREIVSVSDEGCGIYAAMNQGVRLAKGEWVIFLNSGDEFFGPAVISSVPFESEIEVLFGRSWRLGLQTFQDPFSLDGIWKGMPFCHQAAFCRRELLVEHPFDPQYTIAADFGFFLAVAKSGARFRELDVDVCETEPEGFSEQHMVRRVWQSYRLAVNYSSQFKVHRYYAKKLRWAFRMQGGWRSWIRTKLPQSLRSPSNPLG